MSRCFIGPDYHLHQSIAFPVIWRCCVEIKASPHRLQAWVQFVDISSAEEARCQLELQLDGLITSSFEHQIHLSYKQHILLFSLEYARVTYTMYIYIDVEIRIYIYIFAHVYRTYHSFNWKGLEFRWTQNRAETPARHVGSFVDFCSLAPLIQNTSSIETWKFWSVCWNVLVQKWWTLINPESYPYQRFQPESHQVPIKFNLPPQQIRLLPHNYHNYNNPKYPDPAKLAFLWRPQPLQSTGFWTLPGRRVLFDPLVSQPRMRRIHPNEAGFCHQCVG